MDKIFERFHNEVQKEYTKNQDMLEQVIYQKQQELVKKSDLISERENEILTKNSIIKELEQKINDLKTECQNYENVSIHKNLDKQLSERDNEIRILNNRLTSFEKKYDELNKKYEDVILQNGCDNEQVEMNINENQNESTNEIDNVGDILEEVKEVEEVEEVVEELEDVEEVDQESDEEVEEIEVEFIEKRLKPKDGKGRVLFLITDDEQKDIYTRLEDGEPDEHVGRLVGKNNRPQWF